MGTGMRNNIKEIRKNRKMTQRQLAEKANVSKSTIERLESGKLKNIEAGKLLRIAEALDTSVNDMMFG